MNSADPAPSVSEVVRELDRLISQARAITDDIRRTRLSVEHVNQPLLNLTFSSN